MTEFAKEILPIHLEDEMRHSYLDYAMSVIVGRALPDVRDGLKPVHRRVLFAMSELGNDWNKSYKKSARVVGDVIGKYHPHGDTAVYDTIVRMAQPFSMRYMLVDGQGNFGSVDGDAPAAMRYTEVRLARIAHELLADIDKETVDYAPNYDDSEQEPTVLPARIPNLLINGSAGIAVGMATNIPPHNLSEVVDACVALIDDPTVTIDDLMRIVPGPDFPTAAMINGAAGIREAYRTGRGRIYVRARAETEEEPSTGRQRIVVTELPYQVNKARLLEKIAELVKEKRLEGITELRDESDKDGLRVVIELRRGEMAEVVLNNLYQHTQLQSVFGINVVALVDGQPRTLNLKQLLEYFLRHRREVVTRRTLFDLRKARERAHVLEGLAVALANIDEVIVLIKAAATPAEAKVALMGRAWRSPVVEEMLVRAGAATSRPEDLAVELGLTAEGYRLIKAAATPADAKVALMSRAWRSPVVEEMLVRAGAATSRPEDLAVELGLTAEGYRLSDAQAQAILDLRLHRLTGLEQDKILAEYGEIIERIRALLEILSSPERLMEVIRTELLEVKEQFGDRRRTEIVLDHHDLTLEDLIPEEDVVVTLSHSGYAKSQPVTAYQAQRRGGKGKLATATKEADFVDKLFVANSHDTILCFSSRGRVYWLKVYELPQAGRNALGKPMVNLLPLEKDERINAVLPVRDYPEDRFVFMATASGTVKKTPLADFSRPRPSGIIAVDLREDDRLVDVALTDGSQQIMLFTSAGKAVRFDEHNVRAMGRTACGVRGVQLDEGQRVIALIVAEGGNVLSVTENGYGKRTPVEQFPLRGRGGKGVISIRTSDRNGAQVGAILVADDDEVMLITDGGKLVRTRVADISVLSRDTQGVKLISLAEDERLVGIDRVASLGGEDEPASDEVAEELGEGDSPNE